MTPIAHSRLSRARRQKMRRLIVILTVVMAASAVMRLSAQGSVTYLYDVLGRLVGVVDPTGAAAVYTYDAVGNLLSIQRVDAGTLSIISFTPTTGPAGATVTVSGTGFSPVASQNMLLFNGTAASIASATATQLIATIPSNATSGPISVTTSVGSVTSTSSFLVTAVPIITSFSPAIAPQSASVTITGANFNTTPEYDNVLFSATRGRTNTASSTVLTTTVPPGATTGRIGLTTPDGAAISGTYLWVPPPPYVATDVATTAVLTPATATTVSMATPNQIALLAFDRSAGQRVSMYVTKTVNNWMDVTLRSPNSATVFATTVTGSNAVFMDVQTLSTSGTYAITLDPQGTGTGNATVTLYDVPPDVAGSITPTATGGVVTQTYTASGQNGTLTFSGTAGQRVSMYVTKTMTDWVDVALKSPTGSTVATTTVTGSNAVFMDVQTLPTSGTYTITLSPEVNGTGNVTVTLYDVPPDAANSITPTAGGTVVTQSYTTPGQNGTLTFSGTAGQRVSMWLTKTVNNWVDVALKSPTGSTVSTASITGSNTAFVDVLTLPISGTYTITLDPEVNGTGNATVTLYDVPSDATGSITPTAGGTVVTQSYTTPGQNGTLTFSGTAGQRVSMWFTKTVNNWVDVALKSPTGSTLATVSITSSNTAFIDVLTLPTSGTYTITLSPEVNSTGNVTITLYDVPPDATGSITPTAGGTVVTQSYTTPGQNGALTFSGTAGQRVSLWFTKTVNNWVDVALKSPTGSTVATVSITGSNAAFMDVQTLPTSGTYTVTLNPEVNSTGNVTVTLYDVPPDTSSTTAVGGSGTTVTTTTPGQNAQVTFSGTAGQQVTVHFTGNSFVWPTVKLLKPDNSQLTSGSWNTASFNLSTVTLPTTGTYTVTIDPNGTSVGNATVSVTSP